MTEMEFQEFSSLTIANITLRSLVFVAGLVVLILSFGKGDLRAHISSKGSSWFRVTLALFLLAVLLNVVAVVVLHVDPYSVPRNDWKHILTVPTVATFFQAQSFATMMVAQMEVAAGLRQQIAGDKGSGRGIGRVCVVLACVVITILNIAELVGQQSQMKNAMRNQSSDDAIRALLVLDFVIYLLLCIGAFAVLIYTATIPQVAQRAVYFLILAAAIASFARALWDIIISGIFSLGPVDNYFLDYPEIPVGLPMGETIMQHLVPLVAFILILVAWRKQLSSHVYDKTNQDFVPNSV